MTRWRRPLLTLCVGAALYALGFYAWALSL